MSAKDVFVIASCGTICPVICEIFSAAHKSFREQHQRSNKNPLPETDIQGSGRMRRRRSRRWWVERMNWCLCVRLSSLTLSCYMYTTVLSFATRKIILLVLSSFLHFPSSVSAVRPLRYLRSKCRYATHLHHHH